MTSQTHSKMHFLTISDLKDLNARSLREKRNMTIPAVILDKVPEGTLCAMTQSFLHNDSEIRARFILNDQGLAGTLDMPIDVFNRLPYMDKETKEFFYHDGTRIPTADE